MDILVIRFPEDSSLGHVQIVLCKNSKAKI